MHSLSILHCQAVHCDRVTAKENWVCCHAFSCTDSVNLRLACPKRLIAASSMLASVWNDGWQSLEEQEIICLQSALIQPYHCYKLANYLGISEPIAMLSAVFLSLPNLVQPPKHTFINALLPLPFFFAAALKFIACSKFYLAVILTI